MLCRYFPDNAFGIDIPRAVNQLSHPLIQSATDIFLPANAGAHLRYLSGIVTQAQYSGVEHRSAIYTLTLRPWTHLLTLTSNHRVFQTQSPVTIIETILQSYGYPYRLALTSSYPILDYQIQFGESDDTFIRRIAQEHGINMHYEHSAHGHTLILSDHLGAFPAQPSPAYQTLYVYPPELKLQEEYLHSVTPRQRHTVGQIHLSDYQFKTPTATPSVTAHNPWGGESAHPHNRQEIYDWQQGDYESPELGQLKANLAMQTHRQHGHRAHAQGNVRGVQVGHSIMLANHPSETTNRNWIVIGQNIDFAEIASESITNVQHFSSKTSLLLHPDTEALRPDSIIAKPLALPQTATVVGPAEQEVWTDQYGRIKIQFHWDRYGTRDQNSTCWLRVSTAWAGNEYGASHVPRIGSEVAVHFMGGDPDMPIIIGRMSNPEQMPPWSLPTQYSLSGYRSKEIEGNRYNKLILDDTTGNIQAQLGSDHQTTELHLGHITRIRDNQGRTDHRGQGFELRTDGHGAVRAGAGLLISTHGKHNAIGHITELKQSANRLDNAVKQQKLFNQIAIELKADERAIDDTAHIKLNQQHSEIAGTQSPLARERERAGGEGRRSGTNPNQSTPQPNATQTFPELTAPHLILDSAASIALASPRTIHIAAGEHIAMTSGKEVSMSVGKRLIASVAKGINLLAHTGGLSAIAGKGKITLQAQTDAVEITAQKILKIISAKKSITFAAAEEILLTAGGSYVKLNSAGIEHGTTANYKIHAASHPLTGPKSMAYELPKDPYDEMYVITNKKGKPVPNFKYIICVDGTEYRGITNEKGEAMRIGTGKQAKNLIIKPDTTDDDSTQEPR